MRKIFLQESKSKNYEYESTFAQVINNKAIVDIRHRLWCAIPLAQVSIN